MPTFKLIDPSLPRTTLWDAVNPAQMINALQAMPLMDKVTRVMLWTPQSEIRDIIFSGLSDIKKVQALKAIPDDKLIWLIDPELTNEIKGFGK